MSISTNIGWTQSTWPIVTGCNYDEASCADCYAVRDAWRLSHNPNPKISAPYRDTVKKVGGKLRWTGVVHFNRERLDWPMTWKEPRMIFVSSLGDVFHESLSESVIWQIFNLMRRAHWHTFQVLTHRIEVALKWFEWFEAEMKRHIDFAWPLPNVWIVFSAGNQSEFDAGVPMLVKVPAVVRGVSLEPLLGPINLEGWLREQDFGDEERHKWVPGLDWVIAGGQSGGNPRRWLVEKTTDREGDPLRPKPDAHAWVRSIRDQCVGEMVPFYFKQWGGPKATSGGRLLDGRTWDEFPQRTEREGVPLQPVRSGAASRAVEGAS